MYRPEMKTMTVICKTGVRSNPCYPIFHRSNAAFTASATHCICF